jgi:hypothetical protein
MTSVPFGASPDDTGEFMLGEVAVTVVLLESNGQRDANTENWTTGQIERVKQNVREGLAWWETQLDAQNSVHDLNFTIDFQYADQPIATSYEPISRPSDDFVLWMEDFFATAAVEPTGDFSHRIRQFNHQQRVTHDTHWAFTIFVVNAASDSDRRFDRSGSFSQSFAFAGGRFFVTTSERPASAIAHETGHMFWALDEYAGSKHYVSRRGYYNTQNLNAFDGHPAPEMRVRSIMDSHGVAFPSGAISPSAMEMIGWKDSDGDGIFDVLDVPHALRGSGTYHAASRRFSFTGFTQVQTLDNLNTSGTGNEITINRVDEIQGRFDQGEWFTVQHLGDYQAELAFMVDVPSGASELSLRAIDLGSGVVSETWTEMLDEVTKSWQNPRNPFDINDDFAISPLDALLIINRLNIEGAGELSELPVGPPYLDSNGDGFVSPVDALMVINQLNASRTVREDGDQTVAEPPPEGEWMGLVRAKNLAVIPFANALRHGASQTEHAPQAVHRRTRAIPTIVMHPVATSPPADFRNSATGGEPASRSYRTEASAADQDGIDSFFGELATQGMQESLDIHSLRKFQVG